MPDTYEVLAPLYDRMGMGQFAANMTPRLLTYAQQNDWMGRRILDLGSGTGASTLWLARKGYLLTSVDNSSHMLSFARAELTSGQLDARILQQDIREPLELVEPIDMALALDVINELDNLRELEVVFRNVHNILGNSRLFVFDLHTVEGLTLRGQAGDRLVANDADLAIFTRNSYDYDRQVNTSDYVVFRQMGGGWERAQVQRILRGYPVQAIASLLRRCGYNLVAVVDERLSAFELGVSSAPRVIFIARKQ